MSSQKMARQHLLRDLYDEHQSIEDAEPSPYLSDMESYYLANPAGFRGKIMMATWIPRRVRVHMIDHIALLLRQERRRVRRVTFRQFARDPAATKAQTKRFSFGKRKKDGAVYKQNRKTGRFSRFSKREREVLRKS